MAMMAVSAVAGITRWTVSGSGPSPGAGFWRTSPTSCRQAVQKQEITSSTRSGALQQSMPASPRVAGFPTTSMGEPLFCVLLIRGH